MGVSWRDIARGIGGAASGVLDVREKEDQQAHEERLIRIRYQLDNAYQSKRDAAHRKFTEKLEATRHRYNMEQSDYNQKIRDDVAIFGTMGIAKSLRKGLESNDIVAMQIAGGQIQLAQKLANREEFTPEEMKSLDMLPAEARIFMASKNAQNSQYNTEMKQKEVALELATQTAQMDMEYKKEQIAAFRRNPTGMTQPQIKALQDKSLRSMQEMMKDPNFIEMNNRLSEVPEDKQEAYLDEMRQTHPTEVDSYELMKLRLEAAELDYQHWGTFIPGWLESQMQQPEPKPKPQPKPKAKKKAYGGLGDIGGVPRAVEKQAMREEGIVGKPLQKGMQGAIEVATTEVEKQKEKNATRKAAKAQGVDMKQIMPYSKFEQYRKDGTLKRMLESKKVKANILIYSPGQNKIVRLTGLNPPTFEDV